MENDDKSQANEQPDPQQEQSATESPVQAANPLDNKKKRASKQVLIAWILAALLAVATGVFAWLYFTKEAEPHESTGEETTAETQETTETDEFANEDSGAEANQTVYEAAIGQFSLELDPSYVVIERLDGPFEGGPATIIDIAETTDAPGVVETNPAQAFTIFARPEEGATLSSNSRTFAMEDNDNAMRLDDGEFAGEATRIYRVDGLFSIRHVIWVKNGNVYEITHINEDETHAAMLRVVEAGISFVE